MLFEGYFSLLKVNGVAAVAQENILEYVLKYFERPLFVLIKLKIVMVHFLLIN